MKKILFLHGFFATGSCPMARALKEAFEGTAVVLTPDLPLHPKEALKEIRSIIDREQRRTRQTLWGAVQMLTQKHVAKRYIISQKVVPLHHETERRYKYV